MTRALRAYGRYVAVIVAFAAVSVVVGAYILTQQRLQLPFQSRYDIRAAFPTTAGLTPGLGQPANVAGVKVGQITAVSLADGNAVVTMSIDPHQLPHVYANASAVLHPNTPLADMQIDIDPGGSPAPPLRGGQTIPVAQTRSPLQSDDFLRALDGDTRDYVRALASTAGVALPGEGPHLRTTLRTLGPTSHQIRVLSAALADRRQALERVVHNLSTLAVAAGSRDRQLAQVVDAGDATLHALATQQSALSRSVAELPATLADTRRTLVDTTSFTRQLGPTLTALEPSTRRAAHTLRTADKLLRVTEPVIANRIRPFTRTAIPPLKNLLPATTSLSAATPDLSNAALVLQYLVNELLYNGGGPQRSYAYWLAWYIHNSLSVASTGDAHGAAQRGPLLVSCASIANQPQLAQVVAQLVGSTQVCTG